MTGAMAASACLGVLMVAASLTPATEGVGTHMQLGLPPCGMMVATGYPCPSCGMTTAFALAANREPLQAFANQPFGAILVLVAAVGFWGGVHTLVFGVRTEGVLSLLWHRRVIWIAIGLWMGSWVYKLMVFEG
jgi:hypothetical protein